MRTPPAYVRLLGFVLTLLVAARSGLAQAQANGVSRPPAPVLTLPFELASNKIYVQTRVNAEGPFPFVFDTGAPFSVVDWDLAEKLGIQVFATGTVGGAGHGTVKLGTATGVRLSIDGLHYRQKRMEVIPLNTTLSPAEGRDVMGLIGGDVAERFVCEFDFAASELKLHTPRTYTYEGPGSRIPVTIRGHVLARASVEMPGREPISGVFIVDTGARLAVSLNTQVVNNHKLLEPDIKHIRTIVGWGIGGPLNHGLARATSLKVGGVTFDAPTVALSQDTRGVLASPSVSGVIGNEVLKRCRVILDYSREHLILEPNEKAMKAPFPADCSGMFVIAGGDDYRTFTVKMVVTDSPASEAGIREEDVIERIGDAPAREHTLEKLRELLRIPARTHELELKRGDERVKVKLVTRELI